MDLEGLRTLPGALPFIISSTSKSLKEEFMSSQLKDVKALALSTERATCPLSGSFSSHQDVNSNVG